MQRPKQMGWPRTDGQALAEFALVFPIFALLVFGLISFSIWVYTASALNQTAREAARYGSVPSWAAECPLSPAGSREACVREVALNRLSGVDRSSTTVVITCWGFDPTTATVVSRAVNECRAGDTLRVATTAPVRLPGLNLEASGTAEMTVN